MALVAASSKGLGKAIAEELAAEGEAQAKEKPAKDKEEKKK